MTGPDEITRWFPESMQPEIRRLVEDLHHRRELQVWKPMFVVLAETSHRMVDAAKNAAATIRPWWLHTFFVCSVLACLLAAGTMGFMWATYQEIKTVRLKIEEAKPITYLLNDGKRTFRFKPESR